MAGAKRRRVRASRVKALWRARRLRRTVARAKGRRHARSREGNSKVSTPRSRKRNFLRSRLFIRLVLFFITLLALSVLFPRLLGRAFDLRNAIVASFGAGLVPLVLGIGIGLWWVWRHPKQVLRRWNRWLAGAVFLVALLGALAFFRAEEGILKEVSFGGTVGLSILGYPDFVGFLRLLALLVVGFAFMAPRRAWRSAKVLARWLAFFVPVVLRLLWKGLGALLKGIYVGGRHAFLFIKGKVAALRRRERKKAVPESASPQAAPSRVALEEAPKAAPGPGGVLEAINGLRRRLAAAPPISGPPRWRLPPMDILDKASSELVSAEAVVDNDSRARAIERALSSYGVDAKVVQISPGPTVTQFGVEPGWTRKYKEVRERGARGNIVVRRREVSRMRVKVDSIIALEKDLTLALAAPSIRIEAPVPGKPIIGIEVPNKTLSLVGLRSVMESTAFHRLKARTRLLVALGKGSAGEAMVADLTKMPHLLIAGATGSGKSVCIGSIICTLLMNATPDEVRFLMVDPKRVELVSFNSIPHLLHPVIVDFERVMPVLRWLNHEMDARFKRLSAAGAKNIEAFNRNERAGGQMPYIVLFIDELADLIMVAPYEVEHDLCRLAQLGRATGIHLVVATQRPSVDVITGLIKANFPTRLSFAVSSSVDSRVVLDGGGAEKLLGRGDMLFLPQDAPKPKRLQGTFVSEGEIERLVHFWNGQKRPEPFYTISEELASLAPRGGGPMEEDALLEKAKEIALEHKHVSASLLQRRLRIGYPRAARLIDLLEAEGIVGPGESGKSREVIEGSLGGTEGEDEKGGGEK